MKEKRKRKEKTNHVLVLVHRRVSLDAMGIHICFTMTINFKVKIPLGILELRTRIKYINIRYRISSENIQLYLMIDLISI